MLLKTKKRVTYIVSNINKALAFEWITLHINKEIFELNFILLNFGDSELERFLIQNNIPVNQIKYKGKRDIFKAIFLTYRILRKKKINVVHTHLFDANIIGLFAAWLARIPMRIYTRHHSTLNLTYYPKAVKYDKFINFLSTDIIAISKVVENILIFKEHVNSRKVHLIHHGFKLEDFTNVQKESVTHIKYKYNINGSSPIIGVISRYIKCKGIQFIIPAFKKLLTIYPHALLILSNTVGNYKNEIQDLLKTIPKENYIEIPFEYDIFSLYKIFDIFIHVPTDKESEAFGQIYVEALAAGIPSIFTLSGVANEFIVNNENAIVVPYESSDSIYNAMDVLLKNPFLSSKLVTNGKNDVYAKFYLNKMIKSLEQLYDK